MQVTHLIAGQVGSTKYKVSRVVPCTVLVTVGDTVTVGIHGVMWLAGGERSEHACAAALLGGEVLGGGTAEGGVCH